jgi:hypothetical protein
MADVDGEDGREAGNRLGLDRLFETWQDDGRRPSGDDVLVTAWTALDGGVDTPPSVVELERERAMRRLALFQLAAPYFASGSRTWEAVFADLTDEDRERAEQLLGRDSLSELLD